MSKLIVIVPALLTVACAAQRGEIAAGAAEAGAPAPREALALIATADDAATVAAALPEGAEVKVVEMEELDNGLVCEARASAGTRITRRVCYSREEYAAIMDAQRENARRYLIDLEREQRMLAIQQQEMEEQQRRALAR